MKEGRIMIAAPKSGSGKTTVTCALLQGLKNAGKKVVSYKCGPDYIDPMFHERVLGISSKNLDTFFTGEEETRRLFRKGRTENEIAVIEGVMGIFDGAAGIHKEGSSYHLAQVTQTPIILVADVKGMGYSMIPFLAGFLAYDTQKLIKGVVLNRISGAYYGKMKPLIEQQLSIKVVGYLPEDERFRMESRHLGLVMPEEIKDRERKLYSLSEEFQKSVSLEAILQIAREAKPWEEETTKKEICKREQKVSEGGKPEASFVLGVAKDEAFCFYYEDNLQLLEEWGAQIVWFSPLHDAELPKDCCGILLGGGYPELYAAGLSQNKRMLRALRRAVEDKMPIVAECGGFMYLHEVLEDKEKRQYAMAGILPGKCFYTGKAVRFGYMELEDENGYFLPLGERIRGHEFHYFDSEHNGEDCMGYKPFTERKYSCMIAGESMFAGFPHLYYPSNPAFAEEFAKKCRLYGERKERVYG